MRLLYIRKLGISQIQTGRRHRFGSTTECPTSISCGAEARLRKQSPGCQYLAYGETGWTPSLPSWCFATMPTLNRQKVTSTFAAGMTSSRSLRGSSEGKNSLWLPVVRIEHDKSDVRVVFGSELSITHSPGSSSLSRFRSPCFDGLISPRTSRAKTEGDRATSLLFSGPSLVAIKKKILGRAGPYGRCLRRPGHRQCPRDLFRPARAARYFAELR